jgi:hypothetical protein
LKFYYFHDFWRRPEHLSFRSETQQAPGVRYLLQFRQVDERRVLFGLPHPSGSNGHRVRRFAEQKEKLREDLEGWFSRPNS